MKSWLRCLLPSRKGDTAARLEASFRNNKAISCCCSKLIIASCHLNPGVKQIPRVPSGDSVGWLLLEQKNSKATAVGLLLRLVRALSCHPWGKTVLPNWVLVPLQAWWGERATRLAHTSYWMGWRCGRRKPRLTTEDSVRTLSHYS